MKPWNLPASSPVTNPSRLSTACWTLSTAIPMPDAHIVAGSLSALKIVLVAPRNPLNIGAAARAMSNFGVSELRLVNPYDVAFREARSAVKARGILTRAREYPALAEAVADC